MQCSFASNKITFALNVLNFRFKLEFSPVSLINRVSYNYNYTRKKKWLLVNLFITNIRPFFSK